MESVLQQGKVVDRGEAMRGVSGGTREEGGMRNEQGAMRKEEG